MSFIDNVLWYYRQTCDSGLQPKVIKVHDEKEQYQSAQQGHAARIPLAACRRFFEGIFHRSCFSVLKKKHQSINDVNDQSEEENNFHGSDDEIGTHEVRPFIKRHTTIVEKDHCIDCTVNDEERDEKKPGERHPVFFHERTTEETFGHIACKC